MLLQVTKLFFSNYSNFYSFDILAVKPKNSVNQYKIHYKNKEQCTAEQPLTDAVSCAVLLATAAYQFPTGLCGLGRVVQHTSQVSSPFVVLDECILCKGKSNSCAAFLSEQLLSCFVGTLLTALVEQIGEKIVHLMI